MARLPRLSMPGVAHYLLQRGHNGGAIAHDAVDADRLLQVLREAARSTGVTLHAYALRASELRVLATPDSAAGVSRMMQAVGRRFAAGFNRRYGRSGGLWDGRFRSALVEPGHWTLLALRQIDGGLPAAEDGPGADAGAAAQASVPDAPVQGGLLRSSVGHRIGGLRDAALIDPEEYWELGNTPFERESNYRALVARPPEEADLVALSAAVHGCWALGSARFLEDVALRSDRPTAPRPRGRPRGAR